MHDETHLKVSRADTQDYAVLNKQMKCFLGML